MIWSNLPFYLLVAVVFLTMISLLVAAHEYGHYLFARIFGMGVEEFAIGMGKRVKLLGRKTYQVDAAEPGGEPQFETTDFTIRALPIGGFVRIKGMVPEDDGSETKMAGGFYSKPPWQRFIVLFAGPVFSVVTGILILIPLYTFFGIDRTVDKPILEKVNQTILINEKEVPGPAAAAGLKPQDRILTVDGQPVDTFYALVRKIQGSPDRPLQITYQRGSKVTLTVLTPAKAESAVWSNFPSLEMTNDSRIQGVMGASPASGKQYISFSEAAIEALYTPIKAIKGIAGLFVSPKKFERSVGGPGTMVAATAVATNKGLYYVFWLSAMLSISVGIFNLLPIVPLDGGQMVVAIAEMLRRGRRLSMRVQNAVSATGFALVVMFMVAVLTVDVRRFTGGDGDSKKPSQSVPEKSQEPAKDEKPK